MNTVLTFLRDAAYVYLLLLAASGLVLAAMLGLRFYRARRKWREIERALRRPGPEEVRLVR